MSVGEKTLLALIEELRAQVEEDVILERARSIFTEAVAIIDERRRKNSEERANQASQGAGRLHDLLAQKAAGAVPTYTATFTAKSDESILMAGPSHSPKMPRVTPVKRQYVHHKYKWTCKTDGVLTLSIPEARHHSKKGKKHQVEPVEPFIPLQEPKTQ